MCSVFCLSAGGTDPLIYVLLFHWLTSIVLWFSRRSCNKIVRLNDMRYGGTFGTLITAIIIFILSIFTPRQTRSSYPRVTGGQIFWQQDTFLQLLMPATISLLSTLYFLKELLYTHWTLDCQVISFTYLDFFRVVGKPKGSQIKNQSLLPNLKV